jgi:hypothetical protein
MSEHRITGHTTKECPRCQKMSGLSGVDGGLCLACWMGWVEPQVEVVNDD